MTYVNVHGISPHSGEVERLILIKERSFCAKNVKVIKIQLQIAK